ncbi:MAG TPA: ABC transporter ATP-binding protein [Candidatus Avoscillospira avicola]|uniref:Spermidine/putrescine import ATP-binding protein PotA n=1 Tax=Candidatus Avoscillospira avicola TaxID=2840706 RepID=A0A9D1DII6_9FIRM|nr:ABC transporter ATP-binding protein [Candidatus Avoscillospira avicola]
MAKLEIKDVHKSFGKNHVVKGINLSIGDGEFLCLLGPSGCGKTTLLRMIAGLTETDEGQIIINGKDMTDLPPDKRSNGMVFQNYALFPHMTVEQNIAYGLKRHRVPKDETKRRVQFGLEMVRLEGLGKRYPRELSGGQQQRVALARALVMNPDLLLLDEPLSNLDAKLRKEMRLEIRNIQKKLNVTTIFVTHDQEEALTMADTIAIMNGGVVEQLGSPLEMYEHPNTQFVASFIGGTNLIEGEVVTSEGNAVTVRCGKTMLRGLTNNTLTPGQKVITSQRPERLRLHANGETGGNCVRGKITTRVYLGASIRFVVEDEEGRNIIVDLPINEDLEIYKTGAPCFVIWDSDDCHVLDS